MSDRPENLLVHVCCGPCAAGCLDRLPEGWRPVLFFSNANMATADEYARRLDAVRKLARLLSLDLIEDAYDHDAWLAAVSGLEAEPEGGARCARCFRFNLARAAAMASERGCARFTTTLTVSPRKNSRQVFEAGREAVSFWACDFKKRGGFEHSVAMSRRYGLYRQTTCGCEFSQPGPNGF